MRDDLKRYIEEEFSLDNNTCILYNNTINDTIKA